MDWEPVRLSAGWGCDLFTGVSVFIGFSGTLVASCWRRQKLEKKFFGGITFLSWGGGGAWGGDGTRVTRERRGLTAGESTGGAATGEAAVLAGGMGSGAIGASSVLAGAADLGCADSRCARAGGRFAAARGVLGAVGAGAADEAVAFASGGGAIAMEPVGSRRTPRRNSRPSGRQFLAIAEKFSRCHFTVRCAPIQMGVFTRRQAPEGEVSSRVAAARSGLPVGSSHQTSATAHRAVLGSM